MAGKKRDPRTGRYTSGSVEGSEHGETEGTSIVNFRTSQRMSRNPSAQSSRRNSPEGRGLSRQLEWIMEDIRPRLEWKKDTEEVVSYWKTYPKKNKLGGQRYKVVVIHRGPGGENGDESGVWEDG